MLLLEQFENLTLHPKNAAKLKELVLQLAVQGKLTENWRRQNPDVEPAAELLKRIEAEKAQLVKEKKIKKEKPLEPISDDEMSFNLPDGWTWCRIGEIASISSGKGFEKAEYTEAGVRLFQIANVSLGVTSWDTTVYVPEHYVQDYPSLVLKEGDLVMALNRPLLGNKLKIAQIKSDDLPAVLYQRVGRFDFIERALTPWLFLYLSSPEFSNWLYNQVRGINIPFVNQTKLYTHLIALPPLDEQEAIVARVEELMQKIEELEKQTAERIHLKQHLGAAALQQLTAAADEELEQNWLFLKQHFQSMFDEAANVKKLRETILQLAVQGKLTANWRTQNPNNEPAFELLTRIQAEKAQLVKEKKIKKEKPLELISGNEVPYTLPEGWVWCRLSNISVIGTGATPLTSNSDYYENGTVAWITSSSTGRDYVYVADNFITEKAVNETNCKVYPEGTLIVAMYGQGKTRGQVTELKIEAATNQACAAIETWFLPESLKDYIKLYFKKIYEEIREAAAGGAQPNLNLQKIKDTLIPLPSTSEISHIVAKVDQLMQLCDELEQQIEQSIQETEALMQAVVQEALQAQEEVEL